MFRSCARSGEMSTVVVSLRNRTSVYKCPTILSKKQIIKKIKHWYIYCSLISALLLVVGGEARVAVEGQPGLTPYRILAADGVAMMSIEKMPLAGHCLSPTDSLSAPGLLAFGATASLINLHGSGLIALDGRILSLGIVFGALGQLLAATSEWRRGNTLGTTLFSSYGLFWLSLFALVVSPGAGWGMAPEGLALAAYFALWGGFSVVLFNATAPAVRTLRFLLLTLAAYFFLSAAAAASEHSALKMAAGYAGLLGGLIALRAGLVQSRKE